MRVLLKDLHVCLLAGSFFIVTLAALVLLFLSSWLQLLAWFILALSIFGVVRLLQYMRAVMLEIKTGDGTHVPGAEPAFPEPTVLTISYRDQSGELRRRPVTLRHAGVGEESTKPSVNVVVK